MSALQNAIGYAVRQIQNASRELDILTSPEMVEVLRQHPDASTITVWGDHVEVKVNLLSWDTDGYDLLPIATSAGAYSLSAEVRRQIGMVNGLPVMLLVDASARLPKEDQDLLKGMGKVITQSYETLVC